MAITAGTYYVGPAETIVDWTAAAAQVSGQTLTGDVTFIQRGNITQTVRTSWGSIAFGAFNLRLTSNSPNLGNPTSGNKSTWNTSADNECFVIANTNTRSTGKIYIDSIYFYAASTSVIVNGILLSYAAGFVVIHDCLFNSQRAYNFLAVANSVGCNIQYYNCKVWTALTDFGTYAYFENTVQATICEIENITSYSKYNPVFAFIGSGSTATRWIRNCIALSQNQNSACFAFGSMTAAANASSDATGNVGFRSLVPSAQFLSLSDASAQFLNLASGSPLRGSGVSTSIAENTLGIRGNDRPGVDSAVSVGADESDASSSFTIGSAFALMRPWPACSIAPSILWVQDSALYWNGSDRGAAQDAYEATAIFQGRETVINTLEQSLDAYREAVALSGFNTPLFAPNVDHTGTINAVIRSIDRTQLQWGAPYTTNQIYQLEVRFLAISPTLLATTPSWASLRMQDGFRASRSYESRKAFTYAQTAAYADRRSDVGIFEASFSQSTAQIQAILAYLLTTARAASVAFPSAVSAVVPYPWGRARGTPGNCQVRAFSVARKNLNRWNLNLTLVEAP